MMEASSELQRAKDADVELPHVTVRVVSEIHVAALHPRDFQAGGAAGDLHTGVEEGACLPCGSGFVYRVAGDRAVVDAEPADRAANPHAGLDEELTGVSERLAPAEPAFGLKDRKGDIA